jgi:hypothetical protein
MAISTAVAEIGLEGGRGRGVGERPAELIAR